ncbi:MAG TPA: hypothetical protein VJC37_03370 [Planctomycetota bacterium]|nr:hypothetical protein [Planctomycetota bacterium]
MSKTLLIVIGLICALVSAAGMMWYSYKSPLNIVRWQDSINYYEALRSILEGDEKEYIPKLKELYTVSLTDISREYSAGAFYADEHAIRNTLLRLGVTEEEMNTLYRTAREQYSRNLTNDNEIKKAKEGK